MMVPTRPPTPKRPKLSLQTCIQSPSTTCKPNTAGQSVGAINSPYVYQRDSSDSIVEILSPKSLSAAQFSQQWFDPQTFGVSSTGSTSISKPSSPVAVVPPYTLPIDARSILRNSPLPLRQVSATSARAPRRVFKPIKRVTFHQRLTELIPRPSTDEPFEVTNDVSPTDSPREARSETSMPKQQAPNRLDDSPSALDEDGRKRRKDWISRPPDDNLLQPTSDGSSFDASQGKFSELHVRGNSLQKSNRSLPYQDSLNR